MLKFFTVRFHVQIQNISFEVFYLLKVWKASCLEKLLVYHHYPLSWKFQVLRKGSKSSDAAYRSILHKSGGICIGGCLINISGRELLVLNFVGCDLEWAAERAVVKLERCDSFGRGTHPFCANWNGRIIPHIYKRLAVCHGLRASHWVILPPSSW